MTLNWDDATQYVSKHDDKAVTWIPLYRDGHIVRSVNFVRYDGTQLLFDKKLVDIFCKQIPLEEFRNFSTDGERDRQRDAMRRMHAALRYDNKKAPKLAKENINQVFCYETSNGYWSSLIKKLHAYTVLVDTGEDILEGKVVRKVGVKRKSPCASHSGAVVEPDQATAELSDDDFANISLVGVNPISKPHTDPSADSSDSDDDFIGDVKTPSENGYIECDSTLPPPLQLEVRNSPMKSPAEVEWVQKGEDGIYTLPDPAERVHSRSNPRIVQSKYFATVKKYVPQIPPPHVRYARHPLTSKKLVQFLKTHPLGDLYQNPYVKLAGAHTSQQTKTKAKNRIKEIIRTWALTTADGLAYLKECDIKPGELSIDRIIAENADICHGLNFLPNLYLMPVGDNAYFNNKTSGEVGEYKRQYVGETAWKLAVAMNKKFADDMASRWMLCNFESEMHAILRGDM